jgi:hypothetical protein
MVSDNPHGKAFQPQDQLVKNGIVNLLNFGMLMDTWNLDWTPRVDLRSGAQAAAVAVPVTSFQVVHRVSISRRYSSADSRWRRGRKCEDIPENAARNRCACPGEVNFRIARSRARVGWWEFSARLFRYVDRRCSTPGISRRWATP